MDQFQEGLQRLGYQFVPFLLAVVGHEFAHGFVANLWGDKTAENAGRLTLNPIPHLDPVGTLLFPIINMVAGMNLLFGWAKPVPIDPRQFRRFRLGLFCVAIAGPFSNFLMAFMCAFAMGAMVRFVDPAFFFFKELIVMLQIGVFINYGLGFFNLLPFPPLDGSKVVESFLSYPAMLKYEKMAKYSIILLLVLMFTGAISYLNGPIVFLASTTLRIAESVFGVQFV
ncbi:MAG: site-2 protease family protein [Bdellovibrionales bacterium]|nr:site-2 protease family protein [Oligoflexia bacterium]